MAARGAAPADLVLQRIGRGKTRIVAQSLRAAMFLAEGDPIVEEPPAQEATAPAAERAATAATGSEDGGNGKISKREVPAPAVRFPKHWSRRQREAAARREALP